MRCRNAGCNEPSVDDGNSDFSLLLLKVLPLTVSLGLHCVILGVTYIYILKQQKVAYILTAIFHI